MGQDGYKSLAHACCARGSSARPAVHVVVGCSDEPPEAVHDADEYKDDKGLAEPFRQRAVLSLCLTAGYRGFVGVVIRSEGAVVGGWAGEKGRALQAGGIVVGGRRIVWD
jgi:hypothetical protein